ncbi:MAG: hypothetical protein BGO74_13370 [Burkholderiales bacterium 68-12]|nr:acyloxyacyl hydrolase [Burkholderiales bacterium]OJX30959.1 MAG: hypothetical protein BGO74_13370 [Burkholderiales bacterium 68-12]
MPAAAPLFPRRSFGASSILAARAVLCLGALASAAAMAQEPPPRPALYVQWGEARADRQAWILGATLPWQGWSKALGSGALRGHWDLYLGQWSARLPAQRLHSNVLGVGAALQWRAQEGSAPWFVEAGTGLNYAQPRFMDMSTRLNFASHLALGFEHGAQREHEWQLRLQHSSNGGVKKPNPGQNFLQLRYARHF